MKITACIGSSCHVKGSRAVVEGLKRLINDNDLVDKVELAGAFCLGNCQNGVSVKIDDEIFSVSPDTVEDFSKNEVITRL